MRVTQTAAKPVTDCIPRFDQSFNGLCEQNIQDTIALKQRYLESKAKRQAKKTDKKQSDPIGLSNVHMFTEGFRKVSTLNLIAFCATVAAQHDLKCSIESDNQCYDGVMNAIRFRVDTLNTFCKLSASVLEIINE
ncbi:hypothetical protein DBV15_08916 [Temnothorax longispinosus]|uniref:Neurogenic mastermind-like N-terminal domain-containing protein n=1 Tax=Temnothorax longispinosus TaxID=300112 RepID=A0A4S2KFA5_9HYME|nr:hypothetical protein DBV15_08916 [Temnothorax longispinosus]